MEFSEFELNLLLILVKDRISYLRFNLVELIDNKLYMDDLDFEIEKRGIVNSLKSTKLLLNKIEDYWRDKR